MFLRAGNYNVHLVYQNFINSRYKTANTDFKIFEKVEKVINPYNKNAIKGSCTKNTDVITSQAFKSKGFNTDLYKDIFELDVTPIEGIKKAYLSASSIVMEVLKYPKDTHINLDNWTVNAGKSDEEVRKQYIWPGVPNGGGYFPHCLRDLPINFHLIVEKENDVNFFTLLVEEFSFPLFSNAFYNPEKYLEILRDSIEGTVSLIKRQFEKHVIRQNSYAGQKNNIKIPTSAKEDYLVEAVNDAIDAHISKITKEITYYFNYLVMLAGHSYFLESESSLIRDLKTIYPDGFKQETNYTIAVTALHHDVHRKGTPYRNVHQKSFTIS